MCQEEGLLNLTVTVPFSSDEEAEIAYDSLRVDPEPKRGSCTKTLVHEKNTLIARYTLNQFSLKGCGCYVFAVESSCHVVPEGSPDGAVILSNLAYKAFYENRRCHADRRKPIWSLDFFSKDIYNHIKIKPLNMGLLENDAFLNELTKLFVKARNSGSVTLTMKRYDGRNSHLPKDGSKNPEPQEYMCIIRAKLAKTKISTVVHPKDVNKFQQAYCILLRGNMDGLKKLKKTKMKSKTT